MLEKSMMRTNIPKEFLFVINQIFEMENKVSKLTENNSLQRNLDKIKNLFIDMGLTFDNPLGQKYDETRTDCEASIAGDSAENLEIVEVLKPIVRLSQNGKSAIVQKGLVIVKERQN